MKNASAQTALLAALAALVLSACAGVGGAAASSAGSPALASAAQLRAPAAAEAPLSGQYKGTVKDSVGGTGKATGSASQYQSALGGSLTIAFSKETVTDQFAFAVDETSLHGTTIAASETSYCTYSDTASYNSKTNILSGSYKAVYGCAGETGSFSLKQQCYYRGAPNDSIIVPATGVHPC
jgi:hypothetical protein